MGAFLTCRIWDFWVGSLGRLRLIARQGEPLESPLGSVKKNTQLVPNKQAQCCPLMYGTDTRGSDKQIKLPFIFDFYPRGWAD